jgi:hypothetical protein
MQPLPDETQLLMMRCAWGLLRVTVMVSATVRFCRIIDWTCDMTQLTCVCRLTLHCCWLTCCEALDFVSASRQAWSAVLRNELLSLLRNSAAITGPRFNYPVHNYLGPEPVLNHLNP